MNYTEHQESIISILPDLDLLKESEFSDFKNKKFAISSINLCLNLCNKASEELDTKIYFGIKYDQTFNAQAIVKNQKGVIILNYGLIEKLESIVTTSLEMFFTESVASMIILETEKKELKVIFPEFCLLYLFYHEFAHIIQMLSSESLNNYNFQEKYSNQNEFDIKRHIYELDADHFGISISTYKLLRFMQDKQHPINQILLLNLLTALLFSVSNIIILFSEDDFKNIYYKKGKYPHAAIRILECNEQALFLTAENFNIQQQVLLIALQRTSTMIDQLSYFDKGQINYSNLVMVNLSEIGKYIDEIAILNENHRELTRFSAQDLFNRLIS